MPKIPEEIQEALESGADQEGPNFEAFEEQYVLMKAVEGEEYPEGDSGYGGVTIKWEVIQPRALKGRWVWDRFSYSPKAAFRWRQLFEATGYTFDSDTDEIVEAEEEVIAFISQSIIGKGKRKGQLGNNVDEYFEPNDENRTLPEE